MKKQYIWRCNYCGLEMRERGLFVTQRDMKNHVKEIHPDQPLTLPDFED